LDKLINNNNAPLNEEKATYNTYKALYEASKEELAEVQDLFYKSAGFAYNNIPETEQSKVMQSISLSGYLQRISQAAAMQSDAKTRYEEAQTKYQAYESALNALDTKYKNAILLKNTLNKLFYSRYSRFIQEGTWIDESYIDDNLYYNDAMSVLYNSSNPKVSYTIDVISLASLPETEYQMFDFKIGDQTFIEDVEFFGYRADKITPYQEKITVTETSENLDDPTKNTIKVQNYENQFQDLF
jgi:hypothetical protein